MGKQPRWKKTENLGRGKVTPVQIAFIVDRYLSDNNFTQTRSSFRSEASPLISKSPVHEAPKSLLSLGAMLNEYISLKEQRLFMDQEKQRLEQEKLKVQALLQGMQDVMNAYNNGVTAAPLPAPMDLLSGPNFVPPTLPHSDLTTDSPSGHTLHKTPVTMSTSRFSNVHTDTTNFSTPITSHAAFKRSSQSIADTSVTANKRSRRLSPTNSVPVKDSNRILQPTQEANCQYNSPIGSAVQLEPDNPDIVPVQGTSVAKCLFNQQTQSSQTNSSCPKTPARANSSQTEEYISPPEISSAATPGNDVVSTLHIEATNSTVISPETIKVSPAKLAYYTVERNHCISTSSPSTVNLKKLNKRDFVKGRLDFDGSDMQNNLKPQSTGNAASDSDKVGDIFDLDLPNLDCLGANFCLSELLCDFDTDRTGNDHCFLPPINSSPDFLSGSPHTSGDGNVCGNQVLSKFSSTVAAVFSEKDMNIPGPEAMSSLRSIIKCVKMLSPVKTQRSFCGQEN